MPVLITFSGLPGAGKTTIAAKLAEEINALHIEVDAIEAAIRRNLEPDQLDENDRYRVAYGVAKTLAETLLLPDRTVIVDALNGQPTTRDIWVNVAHAADAEIIEIEVVCSDQAEHRRRLYDRREPTRTGTPQSFAVAKRYQAWDRERMVIDTSTTSVEEAVGKIRKAITAPM